MKVNKSELARLSKVVAQYVATSPEEPRVMDWGCTAECGGGGEYDFAKEVSVVPARQLPVKAALVA